MKKIAILIAALLALWGNVEASEIIFAGDTTLAGHIKPDQKSFFTEKARKRIANADLFIWNLEFAGKSDTRKNNRFIFTCDASKVLPKMKFRNGVAVVSNNHSFDGHEQGFENLVSDLEKADMLFSGAAKRKITGMKGADGRRYFIVSYSPITDGHGELTLSEEDALKAVRYLKSRKNPDTDHVIVNIHDGIEGTTNVSERQKAAAKKFADAGADIVSFTHSHRYTDPSMLGDTLILWGVGNFVFGGNSAWRNKDDVRMISVDPASKSWRWIRGSTKDYIYDIGDGQ